MWIDIQQNQDEWLDLRIGKVTGSSIGKVMANFGKAFGDPAKNLAVDIAIERITGKRVEKDSFKNAHMDRGHLQEPIARMLYEDMFFVDVTDGGFYDNGKTGCSPDGHAGGGLIEIKSVIATTHYKCVSKDTYDSKYKWQCFFNMREAGVPWIDFVSYCSSYPENDQLYVCRIELDDIGKELGMIEERLEEFEEYVEVVTKKIMK